MKPLTLAPALAYAAIGVSSMARPDTVPAMFGGTAPTPESRTEIRSVYGGFPLALAGVIAFGGRRERRAAAACSAGFAVGRAAGAAAEGRLRPWPTGFWLGVEVALTAALVAAD